MTETQTPDVVDDHATSSHSPLAGLEDLDTAVEDSSSRPGPGRWVLGVVVIVLLAGGFAVGRSTAPNSDRNPASVAGVDQPQSDAEKLLAIGMELHASGDLAAAEKAYRQVLALSPEEPYALYNIGVIRQTEGALPEAIDFYTRSLAVQPGLTAANYNRALVRRDTGDAKGAIKDLRAVIEVQPENAAAIYNLGNVLIAEGDIAGGTALVNEAVEIDPSLRGDQ